MTPACQPLHQKRRQPPAAALPTPQPFALTCVRRRLIRLAVRPQLQRVHQRGPQVPPPVVRLAVAVPAGLKPIVWCFGLSQDACHPRPLLGRGLHRVHSACTTTAQECQGWMQHMAHASAAGWQASRSAPRARWWLLQGLLLPSARWQLGLLLLLGILRSPPWNTTCWQLSRRSSERHSNSATEAESTDSFRPSAPPTPCCCSKPALSSLHQAGWTTLLQENLWCGSSQEHWLRNTTPAGSATLPRRHPGLSRHPLYLTCRSGTARPAGPASGACHPVGNLARSWATCCLQARRNGQSRAAGVVPASPAAPRNGQTGQWRRLLKGSILPASMLPTNCYQTAHYLDSQVAARGEPP